MKLDLKRLALWCSMIVVGSLASRGTPDATPADFLPRGVNYNSTHNILPYRLFVPDGYTLPANANRSYPLVLFMHGKGERGTDNAVQVPGSSGPVLGLVTGPNRDSFPAFILCPQIPVGTEWAWGNASSGTVSDTHNIIETLKNEFRIDTSHIYVTGLSLGAMGVWQHLISYPGYYAAAVVCSGNGDQTLVPSFALQPVWVFHGVNDTTFDIGQPRGRVGATRDEGGYVVYTEYPNVAHEALAWGSPGNGHGLCTPGLLQWLMLQTRGMPNSQAPFISVTRPAANSPTTGSMVNISGIASDALGSGLQRTILSVAWTNNRGGNGRAAGTSTWSSNVGPLSSGPNNIQFIASDDQNTTFNQLFTVVQTSDVVPPSISITSPSLNGTYSTTSASLNLSGSASDNTGVASVTWSNDRGGSGTATIAAGWAINNIALFNGVNVLTVTAKDAVGNTTTATLTVTCTLPQINQSPVVNAGANQTISLPASVTLNGSVTDDGVPPGSAIPAITWSKFSGPSQGIVTFSSANLAVTTATFSQPGTYVLRLSGSDGELTTSSDVTVTVNPALVPGNASFLFDFGGTVANNTGAITAGNWNNVTSVSTGAKITNAIDNTGAPSTVGLSITTAFNNINYLGSISNSGAYPATAIQDSFFVQDTQMAKVKLTGLNPNTTYTLTFFACRAGGGTNRVTAYAASGTTVTLDATDNLLNTAAISGVAPASDGSIEFTVQNSVGSGYGYLGVLEVQPALIDHKLLHFDLGGTAENGTGAITTGNWNNITSVSTGLKIVNAIDSNGGSSGVGFAITAAFNNINYLGSTTAAGVYPATAMQDSFFTQDAAVAKIQLTGLNPNRVYSLTFFASRLGGGTNRITSYTTGATSVILDATDNTSNRVNLSNLTPQADGTLEVTVKNQSGSGYGYLGVLDLSW